MTSAITDLRAEQLLHVDLKGVRSRKALLEALATGLKLPKHFGHNWDALADCLMDDGWAKADRVSVVLLNAGKAETRFGDDWTTLLEIFSEAAAWWQARGTALTIALA